MYIGLTFVHFRLSGKDPVVNASFTQTFTVSKTKPHLKNQVGISPEEGFLMSRSFMILFVVSVDTWLNENSFLILNFFYIAFILRWKAIFLIVELIISFSDDIEVSSGHLKRFSEPVIDPKCLSKVEVTSICFDNYLSFPSNIIYFCILYFLRGIFI